MRASQFLEALEDPNAPRCDLIDEQAEALRTLLVHLFFVDKDLHPQELELLARVMPDGDVGEYVRSAATRPLDLDRLAKLFPDRSDREAIVSLAEHAMWGDQNVDHGELELVERLIDKLDLLSV